MHTGSCLCGAVRFDVHAALPAVIACHCTQCRKQSGHYWASAGVRREAVTIRGEDRVTWFAASPGVRRGFCGKCGAFLFWEPVGEGRLAIAMGAFDTPTGTRIGEHIFTADKGDYYDIADGAPQHPEDS